MTGLPDLTDLTAELGELSRAFGVADAALHQPAQATDATGSITVVLGTDGRVADVRPASRWRDRLASDQVGDAVVEAAQAAAINRLDAWSQALDAQPEPGTTTATPPPPVDLAALRADAPFVNLLGLLDEVTATLDQAIAASKRPVAPAPAPPATVADEDADLSHGTRPVVVRLDAAGAVEHVDIELRWLAGADRARVGDALTAAFTRAYDLADVSLAALRPDDGVPPTSPELAEIIRNPAAALAAFAAQL